MYHQVKPLDRKPRNRRERRALIFGNKLNPSSTAETPIINHSEQIELPRNDNNDQGNNDKVASNIVASPPSTDQQGNAPHATNPQPVKKRKSTDTAVEGNHANAAESCIARMKFFVDYIAEKNKQYYELRIPLVKATNTLKDVEYFYTQFIKGKHDIGALQHTVDILNQELELYKKLQESKIDAISFLDLFDKKPSRYFDITKIPTKKTTKVLPFLERLRFISTEILNPKAKSPSFIKYVISVIMYNSECIFYEYIIGKKGGPLEVDATTAIFNMEKLACEILMAQNSGLYCEIMLALSDKAKI